MHQYLQDTQYAVENLFLLIGNETVRLEQAQEALQTALGEEAIFRDDFRTSDLNDDFSEAHVINAFHRMASARVRAREHEAKIAQIKESISIREYSTRALQGAILQISKQGISLVYGQPDKAPQGRTIGTSNLTDILWHARNQALHYEVELTNKGTIRLFQALEETYGADFAINKEPYSSLSTEVFRLLGWNDYDTYLQDMRSIFPCRS